MALLPKKTYIHGKDSWTLKFNNKTRKWFLYKNNKKIKTSVNHETVSKLMPDYHDVY